MLTVAVARAGATPELLEAMGLSDAERERFLADPSVVEGERGQRGSFLLVPLGPDALEGDLSSTLVRKALRNNVTRERMEELVHPQVCDELIRIGRFHPATP